MNMKSKKAIVWGIILVILLGLIIWRLFDNKKTLDHNAEMSLTVNTVIPVIVEKPQYSSLDRTFSINGRIEAGTEVTLSSKAQGVVTRKYKKAGDVINKGSIIVQLENDVIRSNMTTAEADLAKARTDVDRFRRLAASGAVTVRELEENEITFRNVQNRITDLKDQLANTIITAPISGILSDDFIEEGSLVTIGGKVADIVSGNSLKMKLSVTEKEVLQLKTGDKAVVTTDVFPGQSFSGTVDMISPQGNELHTYSVEIVLQSDSQELKPGMYATAIFNPADHQTERIIISRKAIVGGMKNPHVWIVRESKAYKMLVQTGFYNNEYIEIIQGISSDDTIISSGQINLSDGVEISILNR